MGRFASEGWIAMVGYIDQNEDLTSVCEGTGTKDDLPYSVSRICMTGDFHGQAPVMWTVNALLQRT